LGSRRRLERTRSTVGDLELPPQGVHVRLDRLRRGTVRIRAAIDRLVARQELGPVTREAFQEVLARAGTQMEDVAPDAGGAGLARGAHPPRPAPPTPRDPPPHPPPPPP